MSFDGFDDCGEYKRTDYPCTDVQFFRSRTGHVLHILDKNLCCCPSYGTIHEFVEDIPTSNKENYILNQWSYGFRGTYHICSVCRTTMFCRLLQKVPHTDDDESDESDESDLSSESDESFTIDISDDENDNYFVKECKVKPTSSDQREYKIKPVYSCRVVTDMDGTRCKNIGKGRGAIPYCTFHTNRYNRIMEPWLTKELIKIILLYM